MIKVDPAYTSYIGIHDYDYYNWQSSNEKTNKMTILWKSVLIKRFISLYTCFSK